MRFSKYLMTAVALLMSMSCSGSKVQNNAQPTTVATSGKTLVVFFSHAGDNYAVGNIEVGNTKIVADYISDITGADQFELVIHKYDGMAYKPLCDLAKVEQQNGELPEFEGKLENLDQYTTVFIGGPVWWGTYPQVMFTFFKQYDLSGKTIIPFTTHEGSGLGRCVEDVKAAYPNATVTDGFEMYGHDVRSGRATVEQWLKSLGY